MEGDTEFVNTVKTTAMTYDNKKFYQPTFFVSELFALPALFDFSTIVLSRQ